MADSFNSPLQPLCVGWLGKIEQSLRLKEEQFGKDAAECRKFYNSSYGEWLYTKGQREGKKLDAGTVVADDDPDVKPPAFRLTINKAAEVVQIFGPYLYQRNPNRKCAPRDSYMPPLAYFGNPEDPAVQQMYMQLKMTVDGERARDTAIGSLMEAVLQFTPKECGLSEEMHLAVDEGLIIGLSCLWTEVTHSPSGFTSVGTFFDSANNLALDHDAKRFKDCMWIARLCCHPYWALEREYGYEPGSLKKYVNYTSTDASLSSYRSQAGMKQEGPQGNPGHSNDMIWYWKIYSKMGIGHRLEGVEPEKPEYLQFFDQVPDYCYLAVAPGMPHPLNVPPTVLESETPDELVAALHWPTPYWLDNGKWPMTPLAFHWLPDRLWPVSHLTPALGELRFINWVYSMLVGKIRIVSRDFLVILKSAAETLKSTIIEGPDYSVIEMSELHKSIDDMVKFLQHPTFNPEIYTVLDRVMEMFDRRTGLTDLLYGSSPVQMRSAQEAQVKQTNASVRPQEMAQVVEDVASELAKHEAAAARWHLMPDDVRPILGSVGASLWETLMLQTDPASFFHEYEVSVEAGSGKRPNKETDAQNMNTALTNFTTVFFQYAQGTMDFGPFNRLVADWCKAVGVDAKGYMMKAPMPPPAPAGGAPPTQPGAPGRPGATGQPAPRG